MPKNGEREEGVNSMTDEQKAVVIELRTQGLGYRAISETLKVKRDNVRDYCRYHGLTGADGFGFINNIKNTTKQCGICGKEVYKRKYCGPECRLKARINRKKEKEDSKPTLVCLLCGKSFKPRNSRERYCCREHGKEHKKTLRTPWKHESRACQCCNNLFSPNFKEQKYCSKRCAGRATIKENEKNNIRAVLKTHTEFTNDLNILFEGSIKPLTDYKTSRDNMTFKCLMCEHEFERKAVEMLKSTGCPRCQRIQSQGSILIEQWLLKHNISFKKEYRFEDCRYKNPLPFDFAIINNGICVGIIEFNGEHHYRAINHWGGLTNFKRVQRNDRIKRNFCNKQQIPVIDIDYNELDYIDEILSTTILQFVVVKPRSKTKIQYATSPGLF